MAQRNAFFDILDNLATALGDQQDPRLPYHRPKPDIQLPNEPGVLLDTNRLPPDTLTRMGRNPSDALDRGTTPLDTNRLPAVWPMPTGQQASGAVSTALAPAPRPSAREAAAIIRSRFPGLVPDAGDNPPIGGEVYGDPSGALALARLRNERASELSDRVANAADAALIPTEGYVQGDPGRRMRNNAVAAMNAIGGGKQLVALQKEIADDPFTGDAAAARTQELQDKLDKAATTMRPEIADADEAEKQRNAFGKFLEAHGMKLGEKSGEYEAMTSPAGRQALEEQGRRDVQRAEAMRGAMFGDLGLGMPTAPAAKLSAQEQMLLNASKTTEQLAPQLMQMLETAHPGIAENPGQYGSWTDLLGADIGGKIYNLGKTSTPLDDDINQLTGFLAASIPKMLQSGRVTAQQYHELLKHVPQIGFTPGENYQRIRFIMNTIEPAVVGGIAAGHGGAMPTFAPSAGMPQAAPVGFDRRDKNWGR